MLGFSLWSINAGVRQAMEVSGNHYELTPSGVLVHPEEDTPEKDPLLFSFVDVLSLSDKGQVLRYEESQALGTLVERWIREHLLRNEAETLGRAEINAAFAYANQRLLQSDATGLNQVAVSIIVALLSPDGNELLIGGVGDSRLSLCRNGEIEPLLQDPLNEHVAPGLSPEERLFSLQNAIGIREHLLVHTAAVPLEGPVQLVATSYGLQAQLSDEELAPAFRCDKSEHDPFPELIKKLEPEGHLVHLKEIATGAIEADLPTFPKEDAEPTVGEVSNRKKQRIAAFGLSAATCALVLGITATMLEPSTSRSATDKDSSEQIAQHKAQTIDSELRALQSAERDYKALITQLESELEESRKLVDELQVSGGSDHPSERERLLKQDLASSVRRISYLEKTVDTLESIVGTTDETKEQLQVALADQEILRVALTDRDQQISDLEKQVATFASGKPSQKGQASAKSIAKEEELRKQLEKKAEQIQELRTKLASAENAGIELKGKVVSAEDSAEELRDRINDLMTNRDALQNHNERLSEQVTILEAKLADVERGESRTEELESAVAELRKSQERVHDLESQLVEVRKSAVRVRELESELAGARESERRVLDLESACAQRDKLVEEMREALQQQDKIIAQLRESRLDLLRRAQVRPTAAQQLSPANRRHEVTRGDTLSQLALQYYGSAQRWRDIYEANRDVIADVNEISVGTTLIIP